MKPLISIVVPVYNTPKEYISRCLNAIYQQDYKNWECIFVDNGSAIDYFDFFTDERIQYTKVPQNIGIFLARKHGVLHAKGDYVIFCDSDDWIDPNICQQMINAYHEDIDVYITKTTSIFESGQKEFSLWANTGLNKAENLGFFKALCSRAMVPWTIWGKVIKKSLLLQTYEEIPNTYPICMGEDFLLTTCYAKYVQKSRYLPINGYFHKINSQSTSLSISKIEKLKRHLDDMNAVISSLDQYYNDINKEQLIPLKKELLASFLIDVPKFEQNDLLYTDILPQLTKIFGEKLVYGAFVESYTVRADSLHWNIYKIISKLLPQGSRRYRGLRSLIHVIVKRFQFK